MRIAPVVLFSALLLLLATAPRPSAGFFTGGSTQGGVLGISKRQGAKWRPLAPLSANAMQRRPTTTTKDRRPSVSALSAGTSNSAITSSLLLSKQDVRAVLSASAFFAMDIITRRSFQYLKLTMFPPSLAACAVLFLAQIVVLPKIVTDDLLPPGANLLAKWLPVFFVPSLITLPLADTAQLEVVKVTTIVAVGFVASLLSTAGTVVLVRRRTTQKATTSAGTSTNSAAAAPTTTTTTTASGPFSARLVQLLSTLTLLTAVASATFKNVPRAVHAAYLVLCTVTTFVYGSQMPKRVKSLLHPLVTCTALTWGSIALLMRLSSSSSFTVGLRLYQTTAGPILLKCLGPAVVSLACSMYARRILMRDNWRSILSAIGAGTVTGLFGTAVAVRWLTQTSDAIRLSLLSRNITSPLAMAMATMLNANVSLAVSMVVVTGLLGANFGATILSAVGITDPVARGLAVGASAHGLGTAALVNEKEAFPFAGAAMALSAFAATIAVAIPPVRHVLTRIALG